MLAYHNRFILDDAFISFRYAEHFASGLGLTFNPGDPPVEGYTNFLWTLLLSIPFFVGADPVWYAQLAGLVCGLGTLLATVALAKQVRRESHGGTERAPGFAAVPVLLLGTNYSFSSFVTSGLETSLQTMLLTWAVVTAGAIHSGDIRHGRGVLVSSLISSAALLTRLDSVVLLLVPWGLILNACRKLSSSRARIAAAALPGAAILAAWFAWKLYYYGALVPNTFAAKVPAASAGRGLHYLWLFTCSYGFFPILALCLPWTPLGRAIFSRWLLASALLWCGYVVYVGGDFMEFRFWVPMLPLIAVLAAASVSALRRFSWQAMAFTWIIAASAIHAKRFQYEAGVESIDVLASHVTPAGANWSFVGQRLRVLFDDPGQRLTISTSAAGAIPFHSKFRTIDQLGLTDAWVARYGIVVPGTVGHQRRAPVGHLIAQNVNLVLGHPRADPPGRNPEYDLASLRRFVLLPNPPRDLPATTRVVDLPLGDGFKLPALYLVPSPIVDRTIAEHGLRVHAIDRASHDG